MTNPFLRRATEFIREDSAFLSIISPEPLSVFIAHHPKKAAMFDMPVRVIGSPGSGKTMMASLVEFKLVEAILRDQNSSGNRLLAAALNESGFIDDDVPLIAAVRLPMESEYRDFWELPYEDSIKTRLVASLIQARALLGLVRNLTASRLRSASEITFHTREGAAAQLTSIGGDKTSDIVARAFEVEKAIYTIGASLIPPPLEAIPEAALTPYQPFEVLRDISLSWKGATISLKPLVILDDVHTLHPVQFDGLFRIFARREVKIGRWMMMRMDALSPNAVFRSADADTLPGLKRDRDYIDIFMQSEREADRRRFRRIASDMANRYLGLIKPLRDRGYSDFGSLLNEATPSLAETRLRELREAIDKEQRKLKVPSKRREQLEQVVARYAQSAKATDLEEDVRLAMLRILMHRWSVRTASQPSLFGDELGPEAKRPPVAKSDVAEGARLYLHHLSDRPFHYGLEALCDASNENAELFLQLAGVLVDRMETRVIRGLDPALPPGLQQSALREKSTAIMESWSFPYARTIKALVKQIGDDCLEMSIRGNARLGAGANAVGIPEVEMEAFLASSHHAELLKYGIAYGALVAVRNYSQGGKSWCLLELPGLVSLRRGLTLNRGGFLEWRVDHLVELIEAL
jgi:hypothetical protein